MRVTLKNFRHHRDAVFDVPDSGLVLFHGESGAGKSTIFNGYVFAMYGKFRRPYSHGENTCSVTVEDPRTKLIVTRTGRPNRLVVVYDGTEYEDEAAQGVINTVLGMDYNEFQLSSYFDQKKHGSVMSMTPSEQLQFVELIAFNNDDHTLAKEKIRTHIKSLEAEQTTFQSQMSIVESQIDTKRKNIAADDEHERYDAGVGDGGAEVDAVAIRANYNEEMTQLRIVQAELQKARASLEKIREKEADARKFDSERRKLQMEVDHYTGLIDDLPPNISEDEIDDMKVQACALQRTADLVLDLREAIDLEAELAELEAEHFATLQSNADALSENIIQPDQLALDRAALENYEQIRKQVDEDERNAKDAERAKAKAIESIAAVRASVIADHEASSAMPKTVKSLSKFLTKAIASHTESVQTLEAELDNANEEFHECPKCKSLLTWDEDGCMIEADADASPPEDYDVFDIEMNLSSEVAILAVLTDFAAIVDECKPIATAKLPKVKPRKCMSLKEFRLLSVKVSEQSATIAERDCILSTIENRALPKSLNRLHVKIKEKRCGTQDCDVDCDVDVLKEKALALESSAIAASKTRGDYMNYNREISTRKKLLAATKKKFLKSNDKGPTSVDTEKHISELEVDMGTHTEAIQSMQHLLRAAERIEARARDAMELDNLTQIQEGLGIQEKTIGSRLVGAYGLEVAARDAEFTSLEKTIGSINEHAKIYLDQMFVDDISVRLIVKKFTKKGVAAAKPSICIDLKYHGHTYDDIEDLSGGERQRCDMAFLMAVNDMLGSNIIMLDECFNNLHGDANMEILMFIKELCSNKQVMVASHESVVGVFDHIVHLVK